MRRNLEQSGRSIPGWNNRPVEKPTALMVVSRFHGVTGFLQEGRRQLFRPLDEVQLLYLEAPGVHPAVFTRLFPPAPPLR